MSPRVEYNRNSNILLVLKLKDCAQLGFESILERRYILTFGIGYSALCVAEPYKSSPYDSVFADHNSVARHRLHHIVTL